jgi:hypothetical protein
MHNPWSKPSQLPAEHRCVVAAWLVCLQGNSSTTQQQQQQPGAPPSEEDLPVWVRREKEREMQAAGKGEVPWPLYLVASVLVAIAAVSVMLLVSLCLQHPVWPLQPATTAACTCITPLQLLLLPKLTACVLWCWPTINQQVGSIFEYVDGNAVFGVIPPDSPLWAPVLGLFAFTGIPMAGALGWVGWVGAAVGVLSAAGLLLPDACQQSHRTSMWRCTAPAFMSTHCCCTVAAAVRPHVLLCVCLSLQASCSSRV